MKQQVQNYQLDLIQQQVNASHHFPISDPRQFRYCEWHLNEIVQQITENRQHSIKWIGNLPNSNILAYFYCVLVGTLKQNGQDNQAFVKLKYSLYRVCKQWLTVGQQKTFVQHLCLVQYSKSVTDFLKKSNYLESILVKIFSSHKRQLRNKNRKKKQQVQNFSKLEELQSHSILFPFISYQLITDKVAKLTINGSKFHIIEEKQCIFVIQYFKMKKTLQPHKRKKYKNKNTVNIINMNEIQTNKKKHHYRQNPLKNFQIVQEEDQDIQCKWLKKPKIMTQNGLVHSISYPHAPINVPLVNSSRKHSKRYDQQSLSEKQSERQSRRSRQQKSKKRKYKQTPSPQPFSIKNVSSQQNIGKTIKYHQNIRSIRTSIGMQLNKKKLQKIISSKKYSPKQIGSPNISPRVNQEQINQNIHERISQINPQSKKLGRDRSWYLSQSVDGSQNQLSIEKKYNFRDKNKIPMFLQKRKDGVLPTDSKFSKDQSKSKSKKSREKQSSNSKRKRQIDFASRLKSPQNKECVIPTTFYPVLNFQISRK